MQVLSAVSEAFPLVKTGGLADVAGALPKALAAEGVSVRTLVPGYPAVLGALQGSETVARLDGLFGGDSTLLAAKAAGLDLFVIEAPHLYDRPGGPYSDANGRDWPDNALRFAALSWVAAAIGQGLVPAFVPDIVHAHDWQAGLAPAYLALGGSQRPGTVITIHNLAHQGVFPAHLLGELGLPPSAFAMHGIEYYGEIGFLKAGLYYADKITTVSPTYAEEIRTPAAGMGLDGLLRTRAADVVGILNGIDRDVWNPATDPLIAARFDLEDPTPRRCNKAALQERLGLQPNPEALLFGVVSRLSWQKGLDLLLAALPVLLQSGAQLAMLSSGDHELEDAFSAAVAAHPGQVGLHLGYDEALAHLVQAGSDALLLPSRFEPCGLTQLCALRYGAVPVVASVGGLVDTVVDASGSALESGAATGVRFAPVTRERLESAIARVAALWRNREAWDRVQAAGMRADFGWGGPARRYAELYREVESLRPKAPSIVADPGAGP